MNWTMQNCLFSCLCSFKAKLKRQFVYISVNFDKWYIIGQLNQIHIYVIIPTFHVISKLVKCKENLPVLFYYIIFSICFQQNCLSTFFAIDFFFRPPHRLMLVCSISCGPCFYGDPFPVKSHFCLKCVCIIWNNFIFERWKSHLALPSKEKRFLCFRFTNQNSAFNYSFLIFLGGRGEGGVISIN